MSDIADTTTDTATAPAVTIDSPLHEKNAALAEWRAANPEPHTPEQKQAHISLLKELFGELDGLVVELEEALGLVDEPADTETGDTTA